MFTFKGEANMDDPSRLSVNQAFKCFCASLQRDKGCHTRVRGVVVWYRDIRADALLKVDEHTRLLEDIMSGMMKLFHYTVIVNSLKILSK